ncbi:MAG: hypothetical protein KC503_44710 [Myxococcales bacterium]|nr:hypothetical protein [Myxococcales bacterium]
MRCTSFVFIAALALATIGCGGGGGAPGGFADAGTTPAPGTIPDITIDNGSNPYTPPPAGSEAGVQPASETGTPTFDSGSGGWPVDIGVGEAGTPPPADFGSTPLPGGACTKHCDCAQGQLCSGGKCLAGFAQIYCCSKAGCPQGQACVDQNGNAGVCNGSNPNPTPGSCNTDCDCSTGQACYQGSCQWTPFPAYCCSKQPCPWGSPCTTAQGSMGTCGQNNGGGNNGCYSDCDCPQGQQCDWNGNCQQTGYPTYCCTKAGCPSFQPCTYPGGGYGHCQ